jgi:hypothetical protein
MILRLAQEKRFFKLLLALIDHVHKALCFEMKSKGAVENISLMI